LLEGLLLEESWLGEAEVDFVSSQLVVAVSDSFNLVLHDLLVEWVQVHFLRFLSVNVDSHTTSSDVRWEADISEDLLVHVRECSGSWSLLRWMVLGRWRDDGSVGNDYDWLFVLGLQFLQNLVSCLLESSEGSVENSNENVLSTRFVSVFVVNKLSAGDKNDAQLLFQIGVVLLNLVESFGHFLFEIRWLRTVFLDDLFSSIEHVCLSS